MKKSLSILLCMVMLLSAITIVPFSASAEVVDVVGTGTSKTSAEAVAWARAQNGKSLDYDGAYGAQCVDLIMYYYRYLGVSSPGGNAKDYTWNALPGGWTRTSSPSEGDIVVWGSGAYMGNGWYANNPYGHIGIVTSVSGSTMSFCNQNLNGQYVEECWNYPVANAATYIHPDFANSVPDTSAPVISNARAENISANSFDIKCDLSDDVGVTRVWFVIYGPSGEKQYGVSASNGAFSHTIYTADHGGAGEYAVGFYAFDAAEHGTKAMVDPIYAVNDTTAPTIRNARAENVNRSSFDIKCDLSDDIGVARIWFVVYGPHGESQFGVPASNGSFTYTIKTSDFGGSGEYAVGFYAFDAAENAAKGLIEPIYVCNIKTTEYNCHHYELFELKKTWKEAKEICERRGGHLAVINSSAENEALAELVSGLSNYVWIGGSDDGSEGNWYWVNGEDFSYTNWHSGEPNNTDEIEHYLTLFGSTKKWNDAANDNQYISGFICEYEPDTILGDADGDGDITSIDVTMVMRANAELFTGIDEDVLMNGDVDGNGALEIIDATFIQRFLALMDTPYSIGQAK